MSPNRIVAILTPLVFAPLAGSIAALAAQHFPGLEISASSLEEVFIAGALIALAKGGQWLHGWQKHEQREALKEDALEARRHELAILQEHGLGAADGPGWAEFPDAGDLLAHDDELDVDDEDLDELEAELAPVNGRG